MGLRLPALGCRLLAAEIDGGLEVLDEGGAADALASGGFDEALELAREAIDDAGEIFANGRGASGRGDGDEVGELGRDVIAQVGGEECGGFVAKVGAELLYGIELGELALPEITRELAVCDASGLGKLAGADLAIGDQAFECNGEGAHWLGYFRCGGAFGINFHFRVAQYLRLSQIAV